MLLYFGPKAGLGGGVKSWIYPPPPESREGVIPLLPTPLPTLMSGGPWPSKKFLEKIIGKLRIFRALKTLITKGLQRILFFWGTERLLHLFRKSPCVGKCQNQGGASPPPWPFRGGDHSPPSPRLRLCC